MQGSEACRQGRSLRCIHVVCKLPEVQVHQAEDSRRSVPEVGLRRRTHGTALEAWEGFLRLLEISGVRFCFVESSACGAVPPVWIAVPAGKDNQARRNHSLLQ